MHKSDNKKLIGVADAEISIMELEGHFQYGDTRGRGEVGINTMQASKFKTSNQFLVRTIL
jgi:hypothetical protein